LSSLLASLLAVRIIGVGVDALAKVGLADVEGDGLEVRRHIGSGAVGADAAELQGFLGGLLAAVHED
jgi:hypothetical protein